MVSPVLSPCEKAETHWRHFGDLRLIGGKEKEGKWTSQGHDADSWWSFLDACRFGESVVVVESEFCGGRGGGRRRRRRGH